MNKIILFLLSVFCISYGFSQNDFIIYDIKNSEHRVFDDISEISMNFSYVDSLVNSFSAINKFDYLDEDSILNDSPMGGIIINVHNKGEVLVTICDSLNKILILADLGELNENTKVYYNLAELANELSPGKYFLYVLTNEEAYLKRRILLLK